MDGRSVRVFKRGGQFVHQFFENTKNENASYSGDKLVWECTSYMMETQEVLVDWIIDGKHPVWTYR